MNVLIRIGRKFMMIYKSYSNHEKKRKLTIFGKKCIINSFAISKLVYKVTILTYPGDEFMKKLLKLIFSFLWKSRERIKRNTLIGNLKDGGIGLVDLFSKFKFVKAA